MLKKWKLIQSESVLKTEYLSIEKRSYRLPRGTVNKDYYHVIRPDYVLIVAREKNGKIILEKQYRRGIDDFIYELPAGWIESGETPEAAAAREIEEELQRKVEKTILLGQLYPQPGFSSMLTYVVLAELGAKVVKPVEISEDEILQYKPQSNDEINDMIKRGLIKDMGCVAAMHLFQAKINK